MQQLVYTSKPSATFTSADVFDIVRVSARNNPQRGLTGFLVYADGMFLQYVEGAPDALDTLLKDLREDPRHADLEIVHRAPVAERHFPEWRMERLATSGQGKTLEQALRRAQLPEALVASLRDNLAERKAA